MRYTPTVPKHFLLALFTMILTVIFAIIALSEILSSLTQTQSTANGITATLDMAMTSYPYVLSICITVMIVMIPILVLGGRKP